MTRISAGGLMIALLLGGCSSNIAVTPPGAPPPAPIGYKLGATDHLRIAVYGEPLLTGEYAINAEGQLSFPIAGTVPAAGMTVDELTQRLTEALSHDYKAPRVSIQLIDYRPIFVLGEVNKAGQYPYVPGMTVLAAVATAGGFTYRANTKTAMVRHVGTASEERDRLTADLMVQPGDTVRIKERYF